jgi:transcriptional regulator with XRE-family HTH domain
MDLVSRLKQFLSQNGIANSQFADTCDIPRPTLSQLLNGRNKKVSDELISKIHKAYPTLSIMWLMFGDGPVFVPNQNSEFSTNSQLDEKSLFDNSPATSDENQNHQTSINFGTAETPSYTTAKSVTNNSSLSETLENIARSVGKSNAVNASEVSGGKRIVNIMVFYSDNSFESFKPTH